MTDHWLSACIMVVVAAGGGWLSPRVLAALPEPAPATAEAESDGPATQDDDVKPLYADIAAARGVRPAMAVAAALIAGSIGLVLGPDPSLPLWCYLSVLGVLLSYVDWHTRLLPFRLVAPSYAVCAALVVLAAALTADLDALVRSAIAWAVVYALFLLAWLVYRRGIGYGDVRLSGILAMSLGWLGWAQVVVGLYAGFLLGAIGGIVLSAAGLVDRRAFAFGPFLLLGTWFGVLAAGPVAQWLT